MLNLPKQVLQYYWLLVENELNAKDIVIEKMKAIEQKQEFSQEDVERIHVKGRELKRQRDELEKAIQDINEDVWKEEMAMSKELDQVMLQDISAKHS